MKLGRVLEVKLEGNAVSCIQNHPLRLHDRKDKRKERWESSCTLTLKIDNKNGADMLMRDL